MSARRRLAVIAGLLALLLLPAPAAVAGGTHHRGGSLVLVGGGLADDNARIYGEIVRLAGGPGRARIGIVTAAAPVPAEDPDAGTPDCNNSVCNGDFYTALFRRYGAEAQWLPIDLDHPQVADDPAVARTAASMTGFFFGGGDQYRYVQTMTRGDEQADSAVLRAIRKRLRAGAVVAGTSAGAQILAGPDMITGGTSHAGVRDGSRPGYFTDATVLGYLPRGGFGFFTEGLVDTHFSRRGRYGRSIRLASDTGHDRVFGLDENTALTVTGIGTGHRRLRVVGAAGVSVLDLRAARTGTVAGRWSIDRVRWTFLTDGDAYAAPAWSPRFAPGKRPVRPAPGCPVTPSEDAFYELVPQALGLLEGRDCGAVGGVTYETDPQFRVELRRGRGATALRAPDATGTSFTGLVIGIHA